MKLYLSQPAACTTTTKRREQNRIVASGKYEAELAFDVLLKLMTETKHRAACLQGYLFGTVVP